MSAVALLTLTLVAFLWGAPPSFADQRGTRAQANRFRTMDTNGDGVITRNEWRGSPRSFRVHDWNNDGVLSGQELRAGTWREEDFENQDYDPGTYDQFVNWTPAAFANLDHNRDNRITPNEWHYDQETFRRVDRNRDNALSRSEFLGADAAEGYDDDRNDQFDYLDANNNGRIERGEWHGSQDAFDWLDRNRDGVLSRIEVVGSTTVPPRTDAFASLDYDRNGVISREEWHWSRGSFDRWDVNGDGVLSRREFMASQDEATSDNAARPVETVRVEAVRGWNDTGLTVRAGDVVTISAQGNVQLSTNPSDTASPAGSTTGRRAANAPIQNAPAGALIARIGESVAMLIGAQKTLTAPVSGRLYLSVNDDHMPDNSGEFQVNIALRRR